MLLKPFTHEQPKCRTFTIMLMPEKYGSTKTFNIPRYLAQVIIIFNIAALILLSIFILNYKNLKTSYNNYLKHNNELKVINANQQQEITELRKSADEINSKLTELQDLEDKLKDKLKDKLNLSPSISRGSTSIRSAYLHTTENQIDKVDVEIASINNLLELADRKIEYTNNRPSILPAQGRITCYFGYRSNPFGGKKSEFHSGVDIANSKGTVIKAAADGVVDYSSWKDGTGNTVIITHKDGYISIYGHCSKLLVAKGEQVKKGQTIALMGSTGRSTGDHVHFEIKVNGEPVDPLEII